MKVLLISANTEKINMPTLAMGLGCVAEATRVAGHEVVFLDLMAEKDPRAALSGALSGFDPQAIGVSIRNIDDQHMLSSRFLLEGAREVVGICRKHSKAFVVVGGAGYSIFPESVLSYLGADMGIQGEGETAFPALLARLEKGIGLYGTPGLYLPGKGLQGERVYEKDLDRFPLPDPGLFPASVAKSDQFWLPFQTRRGCPLGCIYCSTGTIEGCRLRKRSPQAVVREIGRWRDAGFTRFFFVDNIFNLPPSYAVDLCRRLARADFRISWRCILYPGGITEALVKTMAEAGCRQVSLGAESGDKEMLRRLGKRFTLDEVARARRMLGDYGIECMGFLLLGGPGETKQSVEESFSFAEKLKPDALKLTAGIRIYPYTRLARIAVDEGRISSRDDLLSPRYYLAGGLEEWLPEAIRKKIAEHPEWIY